MNCLEFRRRLETEPSLADRHLAEHHAVCSGCAAFATRVARFERRLRQAARVRVPPELASRILLHQAFEQRRGAGFLRRNAAAIAASVLLAATLLVFSYHHLRESADRLGPEVVAMVRNAPYALAPSEPLASGRIERALRPAGLVVSAPIGIVTFAGRCLIMGRLAGHLVIEGRRAPITIFLIPEERVAGMRAIRGHHLEGLLIPAAGGTIAVIGAEGEALLGVAARARAAVRWRV